MDKETFINRAHVIGGEVTSAELHLNIELDRYADKKIDFYELRDHIAQSARELEEATRKLIALSEADVAPDTDESQQTLFL